MGKKKGNRRAPEGGSVNITSMMDMMTIILVFLLKNFASTAVTVTPSEDLQVPTSTAQKMPKMAVQVVVSRKDIVVDGQRVMGLGTYADPETGAAVIAVPDEEKKGFMITKLYDKLLEKAEVAKQLAERAQGNEDMAFKGQILLQCDKRLPWSLVREVMYTAGQAQFGEFKFVVIKGS